MSKFDLNKPCSEQGLTPEQVKLCQEAKDRELLTPKTSSSKGPGAPTITGENKQKYRGWYAGGTQNLDKRRELQNELGFNVWHKDYYSKKFNLDNVEKTWQDIDNAAYDFTFGKMTERSQEIRERMLGEVGAEFETIYDKYKFGESSENWDKEEFHNIWRQQEGFEERFLDFGKRGDGKWKDSYNAAKEEYTNQLLNKADAEIEKIYGKNILDAYKKTGRDTSKLNLNDFDKEKLDALVIKEKRREIELALKRTGLDGTDREVDGILYPALDKYIYGEGDKDELGLLPNERIAYDNEQLRQQAINDGCMNAARAEMIMPGEEYTFKEGPCKGESIKLKEYNTGNEYEQYKKGIQEISERGAEIEKQFDDAMKASKGLLDDLSNQQKKLEGYGIVNGRTAQGIIPSPQIRAAYNADLKKYQELVTQYTTSPEGKAIEKLKTESTFLEEEYKKLEKLGEKYSDVAMILEAGMLNYNLLDKTLATISSSFIDPVIGTVKQGFVELGRIVGTYDDAIRTDEFGNVIEEGEEGWANALTEYDRMKGAAMNYFKVASEKMNQFSASTGSADFGRDGFHVGRYLVEMAADNSPSILAVMGPSMVAGMFGRMAAKGLTGMAAKNAVARSLAIGNNVTQSLFFVSGTADQWGKLSLASYEGDKKLKEIAEMLKNEDLSPLERESLLKEQDFYLQTKDDGILRRGFSSLLYGGADWFAEKYIGSMRVVNNLQKLGPVYRQKGLFGAWRKSTIDGLKATLGSSYRFTAGIGAELLEESFVNLATAFVDKNILKLDRGYLDDFSKDFTLNTAFTSVVMQGPFMAQNVMGGLRYELSTAADRKRQRTLHGKLMGIQDKINRANELNLTDVEVKELEAQKEDLFNQSTIADFLTFNSWTKLDETQRNELVDLGGEIRAQEKILNELTSDPQFGEKGLLKDIKATEAKLKELDAKKADILKSKKLDDFKKQAEEARKENKTLKTVDDIIAQQRVQLYEAALDITTFQFDGDTEVIADEAALEEYIKNNEKNLKPADIEKLRSGKSLAFVNPSTGQIVVNQKVIYDTLMNVDTTTAFTAAIAPLHELLHVQIKKMGIFDAKGNTKLQQSIEGSVLGLKDLIKSKQADGLIDNSRANEILKRIDQYKGKDGKYNVEEVLTTFSEAVIAGDLKKSDFAGLFGVKSMLNSVFAKMNGGPSTILNPFTSTNSVFQFVSDFTNKLGDVNFEVKQTYTMDSTGRMKREKIEEEEKGLKLSKVVDDTVSEIPAEYDVERIETNLELNKDYGNTFIREDNRKKLEEQLARAKKVEGFINESPAELRKKLADETNAENKADLEYALKRQQEVRFPGNVGVTDPITGDPIGTQAPKGLDFSLNPTQIAGNLAEKGLNVSEKQINDMVGKIASRATTKFWSRMSESNQNIVPRKLYKDSAQNLLLEIANNYRQEISKNTGKQVTFDAYMANTGMQRLNSLAADLGAKQKDDKSLSDEATLRKAEQQQQTTEETTVAKPDVTPTVDVMSFPNIVDSSKNTKAFEKDFGNALIKNAKEKGIDLSNPNLTTDQLQSITPYNLLADALGIPVNKISNPKANLSKDESLKIQRALLKARSFVKNVVLGKANKDVQKVESKVKGGKPVKIGGESLKLGRNILKTFFNPPKRLGSGQMVRTPKKFDNKVYEQSIGIKDGKVDPNYKPRDAESQVMKGFLKAIAEQMANRAVRLDIASKPQTPKTAAATANLERGKGDLVFSEVPVHGDAQTKGRINRLNTSLNLFQDVGTLAAGQNFIDFINQQKGTNYKSLPVQSVILYDIDENGKKVRKKYKSGKNKGKVKPAVLQYKLTPELKEKRKLWIRNLAESGFFPKTFFTSGNFAATGAQYGQSLYKSQSEIDADLKGVKFAETKKLPAVGKSYANVGSGKNRRARTPSEMKKLTETQAFKDNEAKKMPYLQQIAEGIENDLKNNPENLPFWTAVFKDAQTGSKSFLRALAPITFYSKVNGPLREEHSMPAKNIGNFILASAALGTVAQNFDFVKNNYFQGALLIKDDNKLKGPWFNYISSLPSEFFTMDNLTTWVRYNNPDVAAIDGGINFDNYQMVGRKTTVSQELAKLGMDVVTATVVADNVIEDGIQESKTPEIKDKLEKLNTTTNLNKGFNDILQDVTGIESIKRYSDIGARRAGRGKGRFRFFIPPGAEDFKGLLYNFLGKGRKGEQHFEFFDKNLLKPYWQAISQIERFRRALKTDYATLLKASPNVRKKLGKLIPTKGKTNFTYDQAIRAYLMDKSGYDLGDTGLSKRDAKLLIDTVKNDPEVQLFADGLQLITKQDKWLKPNGGFDVQTIQSDLHRFTSGEGRKRFLENSGFMQNVDEIFSKENLNKIEAAYGKNVREAIEDMLYRMKNGTNRQSGTNRLTNTFNNWINRSVGAIMFFNRKSALLQTISSVNFINWSDNNPLKAAMAFANQKQYWKDFAFIFNSPKLKERRAGLKGDINEAELADAVRGATNKAEAALAWLLKQGFLPTQMADSFAIASGGATFYRNRINTYLAQGMDQQAAEKQAFEDFSRISEESQQSADPAMISEQQASPLGRFTLNFQNTPMQYTRLMKRAGQDLINRRRIPGMTQAQSDATYISKIIYYGAVQNFIFAALQNALFAVIPGFGGEDDEEELLTKEQRQRKKEIRIANNMVDTLLRGTGIYGAIAATLKNTIVKFYENEGKDPFAKDNADILLEAANLSPVVGSKLRKLNNALKTREFEKDVISERGWEITRNGRVNLSPSYRVLGSGAEALLNIPLERTIAEIDALVEMTDQRNSSLERIALALGWRTWDVGVKNEEHDQIKIEVKERRKREKEEERKRKREEEKRLAEEKRFEGLTNKEINALKRRDQIEALTKQQQVDSLLKLGVTKKEIRSLRLESQRIDKIIQLNTK